jgi:hypothetical protein
MVAIKLVNIENTTISEKAETAGACVGFLTGAAVGAKIASTGSWWLGPVGVPIAVASGALIGGVIGAEGGRSLGSIIATQL